MDTRNTEETMKTSFKSKDSEGRKDKMKNLMRLKATRSIDQGDMSKSELLDYYSFSLAGKGAIWMGARARVPIDYRVKDA